MNRRHLLAALFAAPFAPKAATPINRFLPAGYVKALARGGIATGGLRMVGDGAPETIVPRSQLTFIRETSIGVTPSPGQAPMARKVTPFLPRRAVGWGAS